MDEGLDVKGSRRGTGNLAIIEILVDFLKFF